MFERTEVSISSRDHWFKVVGMLEQNWALVDELQGGAAMVYFVHDLSGVFDRLEFASRAEATAGLMRNGFRRFADDPKASDSMTPPQPPFIQRPHPGGRIYSSGRFWR